MGDCHGASARIGDSAAELTAVAWDPLLPDGPPCSLALDRSQSPATVAPDILARVLHLELYLGRDLSDDLHAGEWSRHAPICNRNRAAPTRPATVPCQHRP